MYKFSKSEKIIIGIGAAWIGAIILLPNLNYENKNPEIQVFGELTRPNKKGSDNAYLLEANNKTYWVKSYTVKVMNNIDVCNTIKLEPRLKGVMVLFTDRYELIKQELRTCESK